MTNFIEVYDNALSSDQCQKLLITLNHLMRKIVVL
ncbi:MAG: hypothetical protein CM15mV3_2190 [Caudoviricetes sp.]|nr:MAG: hypothetical protein CM15mV3_2190 [Caudoviricetes sp.]